MEWSRLKMVKRLTKLFDEYNILDCGRDGSPCSLNGMLDIIALERVVWGLMVILMTLNIESKGSCAMAQRFYFAERVVPHGDPNNSHYRYNVKC